MKIEIIDVVTEINPETFSPELVMEAKLTLPLERMQDHSVLDTNSLYQELGKELFDAIKIYKLNVNH